MKNQGEVVDISIGSVIFAELTFVTSTHTDTQTDNATPSVAIGRIHAANY